MVILDITVVNVALPTDPGRPRDRGRGPPVGDHRLHARLRRAAAARRPRRRPLGRRRVFLRSVSFTAASLAAALAAAATLLAARVAPGRAPRCCRPRRCRSSRRLMDGHARAARARGVGRGRRERRRVRRPRRRRAHGAARLAGDLPHQRPVGVAVAVAALRTLPATRRRGRADGCDVAGAAAGRGQPRRADLRLRRGPGRGLGVGTDGRLLAAAAVGLAAFVAVESRVREPLVASRSSGGARPWSPSR